MGLCLAKPTTERRPRRQGGEVFPVTFTEAQICDYYVDQLPSRLQGEGIHLLRGGPGPIVQGWTHELLNESGVHSFQDRELLLKCRDKMTLAVERHRERRRQLNLPCRGSIDGRLSGSCVRTSSKRMAILDTSTEQPPVGHSVGLPSSPCGSAGGAAAFCEPPVAGSPRPLSASGGAAHTVPETSPATEATAVAVVDKAAAVAAAAAASAAAAEAATANTASFFDTDGKPFRLTSDWLPAGVPLYRISEERLRHGISGLDPSIRKPSPEALAHYQLYLQQQQLMGRAQEHPGGSPALQQLNEDQPLGEQPKSASRSCDSAEVTATVEKDAQQREASLEDAGVDEVLRGNQAEAATDMDGCTTNGMSPDAVSPVESVERGVAEGAAGGAPLEPQQPQVAQPTFDAAEVAAAAPATAPITGASPSSAQAVANSIGAEPDVADCGDSSRGEANVAAAAETAPAEPAAPARAACRGSGADDSSGSGRHSRSGSSCTSRSLGTDSLGALTSMAGATSWAPSAASSSPVPPADSPTVVTAGMSPSAAICSNAATNKGISNAGTNDHTPNSTACVSANGQSSLSGFAAGKA